MCPGLLVIHIRVYAASRAAIMPIMKYINKITILSPKVIKEGSKHRFSGSRNQNMTLQILCFGPSLITLGDKIAILLIYFIIGIMAARDAA